MFYKNQSNNNQASLNTRLAQFYSQENAVTLTAWNNNISIRVQPYIGTDSAGIRQYENSKDKCVYTSITPDNAVALLQGIRDKVIPAINENTEKRVSILIGANSASRKMLTIGFDGENSYMELALNVSDTGSCDPANVIKHTFSTREYMEDYVPTDGTGNSIIVHSDFLRFAEKLEDMKFFTGAVHHGIKYAEVSRASYGMNQSDNNTNTYGNSNNNSNNHAPQYSAPVQNFAGSDMGDFLPFS